MPEADDQSVRIVRFDCFQVDLASGRLLKHGIPVKLRDKSFQVLASLLERPGQLVTRANLHRRLWPADVFVDVENNLNTTIARLRAALGDSAERPRFIETLPKRGYRFVATVSPVSRIAEPRRSSPLRVLVLPFAAAAADPSEHHVADSLTDELIAELARMAPDRVTVIGRETAMRHRGARKDARRVARELGAEWIVQGTVRRSGDACSVAVELTRPPEQTCRWAGHYRIAIDDLGPIERGVAHAVAAEAGIVPSPDLDASSRLTRRPDVLAYNEYVKGRQEIGAATPASLSGAIRHFEQAIARDPGFALAYDGLADAYWHIGYLGFAPPAEAFSTGVLHAVRALEIDGTLAETHALLGQYHKQLHYVWPEVEREMSRALQLDPASPLVGMRYAFNFLMPHARLAEAVAMLERALAGDPLSTYAHTMLALTLLLSRRYGEARGEATLLLQLEPRAYWAHSVIASCDREQGRFDAAIRAQRRAAELTGNSAIMVGWLGLALALAGQTNDALTLLGDLQARASASYVPPSSLAWIYVGLRKVDDAFVWLNRAADGLDQMLMPIKSYAFLDPIRADPRYEALVRKMHLPA